jgi:hypothetical protein
MANTTPARVAPYEGSEIPNLESSRSGIAWPAIIGGAVTAIALSLILLALGSGLGFSVASPWSNSGAAAATVGMGAVVWVIIVQWLSSALGGYMAGRLRTKWAAMHSDEVFFRDTAHGFLAWGLATIVTVWLLASTVAGGVNAAATVASGAAQGASQGIAESGASGPTAALTDTLFRPAAPTPAANASTTDPDSQDYRGEAARILAGAVGGEMDAADRAYLAQVVAERTGLPQADAEKRVDDTVARAKQAADAARKAAAAAAFATALSWLTGAFVAAAAGALGGRHRDLL